MVTAFWSNAARPLVTADPAQTPLVLYYDTKAHAA